MPAGRVKPFAHRPALDGLPEGAGRGIIDQFKAIQANLDDLRGRPSSVTPLITGRNYAAKLGELVLLAPPSAGVLLTIPAGSPENIGQSIRIAVVGGILSPGASVSIVGRKGTINGQQVLNLNSHRLVELVSCGSVGWFFST